MKSEKTLSLFLAVCILGTATLASACASEKGNGEQTKEESAQTVSSEAETSADIGALTEIEKRAYIKDSLPERDYGGKEFRIATKDGTLYEIYTDEENGDILNDALYARNRTVEERFNVKIKPVVTMGGDGNTQVNAVRTNLLAGEDAYDLVATYVFTTGPLVMDGLYLNWLDLPYTDLSQPWWINGINDKFRVGDAIYTTVGDMCVSTLMDTYAVLYNRTLGANYDISFDEIYKAVQDGTWTIDYFISLISGVYSDVNGDSKRDTGDTYGFAAESATNLDVYTFAFDIPMTSKNSEGIPELTLNTAKTVSAVEKINRLYWDGTGSYIATANYSEPIDMFKEGKVLFTTTWLNQVFDTFREMKDEYTILPYPKYDENQSIYMTGAMDNYSVLGVPHTEKDPEMSSIITEALNIESYKTLFPTYYQEALQDKFARDTESIEMLDLLMKGRNFDFVTLFSSTISGIPWLIRGLVQQKSTDFASAYTKVEKAAQKGLDSVVKAYEENAQS